MLVTRCKTLHGVTPSYLKSLLEEPKMVYNLRGTLKLAKLQNTRPLKYHSSNPAIAAPQSAVDMISHIINCIYKPRIYLILSSTAAQ